MKQTEEELGPGTPAVLSCDIVFLVWFFSSSPKSCSPINSCFHLSASLPVVPWATLWTPEASAEFTGERAA